MTPSRFATRMRSTLRAMTGRARLEQEMDSELRFHIESYISDLVRSGVPAVEAARRARVEFGGIAQHKEDMRASLGLRLWDEFCADIAYTVRLLRKSPGFTAVALLSLALGIGANTTIFTFANFVLVEKLHVPDPGQLRLLSVAQHRNGPVHRMWGNAKSDSTGNMVTTSFSYPVYEQLRHDNRSLQDLVGFKGTDRLTASIDGTAEVVLGELVSGNYYQQLGVSPQLGRPIQPEDDTTAGASVILISDGFWARRFGRSPGVIGKTILLELTPFTIIGVNPPGFTGAQGAQRSPDIFAPVAAQPLLVTRFKDPLLKNPDIWWIQIMARAKSGVSSQQAQAQLNVVLDQAVRATTKLDKDASMPWIVVDDGSRGMKMAAQLLQKPILVLLALVGFVLLLACANLANLLLARSSARQREMSVRFALGASRARVVRQILTECLTLAMAGGALGLLLAHFGRLAMSSVVGYQVMTIAGAGAGARPAPPPLDWHVLAFTAAVSVLTGLIFGLLPALQATRVEVNSGLKDSAQTVTHSRRGYAGKAIVAFQVALSTLLVIAAGLFVRTVVNLGSSGAGFNSRNLLLFDLSPPRSRYAPPQDVALVHRLEERLGSVPGVDSVTASVLPLIANSMSNDNFVPDGEQPRSGRDAFADTNAVGERFFRAMQIPIVAGRGFEARDTETSPKVAVVNQALVKHFFPNSNPVGRTFNKGIQIIGVCGDTKYADLRSIPQPTFFTPYRQMGDLPWGIVFEIRSKLAPAALVPSIRAVVRSEDKDVPLIDIRTQEEQIAETMSQERIFGVLTTCFGVLALVLACIGIYGILAYAVARRTNEIGIRIALGARTRQVLAMVLGEATWMAMLGVVAGVAGALALSRFVGSMLYGIKAADPLTFAAAAALLFAVALLAGWLPAHRAARIEPMQALRHE